jgi:tRNA dimethylallyltransferase
MTDLLAIVGPTAVGKSGVALLLAERLGGEIVSADSMQVYRGLDIGTGKPREEELARVRHHLVDVADPREDFSVARYQELARAAIAQIAGRGRLPILVGGSGLYVRAVTGGLSLPGVAADRELRNRLRELAAREGPARLHRELAAVDAETAARLHPNDEKRIIRALEVQALTGVPLSRFHRLDRKELPSYNVLLIGLSRPRQELYRRIEARVEAMFAAGLVEEVARLLGGGVPEGGVATKGLGYAQVAAHLRGEISLAEAMRLVRRDTRRFAKRQLTWFRGEPGLIWLDISGEEPAATADRIAAIWTERQDAQLHKDARPGQ